MSEFRMSTESTYQIDHAERLSEAVVKAVADAEGVGPTDLRPLYEAVDPDALDSLFHSSDDAQLTAGQVEFSYHGYHVHVTDDELSLTTT